MFDWKDYLFGAVLIALWLAAQWMRSRERTKKDNRLAKLEFEVSELWKSVLQRREERR